MVAAAKIGDGNGEKVRVRDWDAPDKSPGVYRDERILCEEMWIDWLFAETRQMSFIEYKREMWYSD